MRYLVLLATLPLLMGGKVVLAPVLWQDNPDNKIVTVRLTDKIVPGDLERIRSAMVEARKTRKAVIALELASWGGDADTGLAIARYVYKNNIDVLLTAGCWSACAYAAMVALGRGNLMIRSGAELGVHQVYDNGTGESDKPWTERAANSLSKMGAPKDMLDGMVETSSDGMTYYRYNSLRSMGALVITDEFAWWNLWGNL